jgi:[acyl-carrier-protein] S-malonyltransferase
MRFLQEKLQILNTLTPNPSPTSGRGEQFTASGRGEEFSSYGRGELNKLTVRQVMSHSLGVVFPGQGSQTVGMLADLAQEFPEINATFNEASAILGYDLWQLTQQGPAEELDKTVRTQPALLAAAYALWRVLQTNPKIKPAILAGHSLGEYTALVCAEAITFPDAIRLVAARGEYMQDAVPVGEGALAAIIGLDDAMVKAVCEKSIIENEVLAPANYNSPGQVVIAGHTAAVERALIIAKEAGARMVKLLPVSVSSHCILMKPAAERLAVLLSGMNIQKPKLPVVSNVDVKIYSTPDEIRDGLIRQLYLPVRWVEIIQFFNTHGITRIIECGPGKVLNGLNKRIHPDLQLMNMTDAAGVKGLLETSFEMQ